MILLFSVLILIEHRLGPWYTGYQLLAEILLLMKKQILVSLWYGYMMSNLSLSLWQEIWAWFLHGS